MNLKDLVENNPVMLSLSLLIAGFLSGIATYEAILRIARLEPVATSELAEREAKISQLTKEAIQSAQDNSLLKLENKNLSYQIGNEKKLLSIETLAQLDGVWVNQSPNPSGITRFLIQHRGADIFVHAWGSCRPTDCDWGEQKALVDQDSAIVLWDQSFVFRKMVIRLNKRTNLTADYLSVFTDDSGRKKYEKIEVFNYKVDSGASVSDSPTLAPTSPPVDTPSPLR
jgi:hypothetical protein